MKKEFRSEQRISNIMSNNLDKFKKEDIRNIYYLFNDLVVLAKTDSEILTQTHERTFLLGKEKYVEIMEKINDFIQSKGLTEIIFRNPNDYRTSVEDYDYYYKFKTPAEYKLDEENRYKNTQH